MAHLLGSRLRACCSLHPWRRVQLRSIRACRSAPRGAQSLYEFETTNAFSTSLEDGPSSTGKNSDEWSTEPPKGYQPSAPDVFRDASHQGYVVQWYPGHIAKAERQLREQLRMVDVVLEVRDARIPASTWHPHLHKWVGGKAVLLIMNRVDMISRSDKQKWADFFQKKRLRAYWTDGKLGDGVKEVRSQVLRLSTDMNAKRKSRGLQPRPARACVIGFPNIGKSALINRLLNRKVVQSAPKPGVTRMLQWVRMGGDLDLLDAPGVIPANFQDQQAAQLLAMCNDIGEAAYNNSQIAAALLARCRQLPNAPNILRNVSRRYDLNSTIGTSEDFVVAVAEKLFAGDLENAGARILKDYRTGALGNFALEMPEDLDRKLARFLR